LQTSSLSPLCGYDTQPPVHYTLKDIKHFL
jgi:hypothetical protein